MPLFRDRPIRIQDHAGRTPFVGTFGGLVTANRIPYIAESFHYGVLNTYTLRTPVTANGGTVSIVDSVLTLDAGTNAAGAASLTTRRYMKYTPGFTSQYMFTAAFTMGAAAASATQWIGCLTSQDGFAVGVNNGTFSLLWRRDGEDTITAASSLDVDITNANNASGFALDPSKINIFSIDFGYLGIADPVFSVYGGVDKGWIRFHSIPLVNTRITTHVLSPNLPLHAEVTKTAGASSVAIRSGSWSGVHIGDDPYHVASRHGSVDTSASLSSNNTALMMLIRCNATYGGGPNYANAFINNVSVATDGNRSVKVRLLLNPTLGGTAPVYTDFDATNSIISYDKTLTGVTHSGGSQRGAFMVEKSGGGSYEINWGEVLMTPGDIIAVTAISAAANTTDVQVEWDELF